MKPGPAPTPTAILKLRGSHRAKTGRGKEPEIKPMQRFEHYKWMSKQVKKKFKAVTDRLAACGVLSCMDRDAVANYSQAWQMYADASKWLNDNGTMCPVKNDEGKVVGLEPWPQVRLVKDLLPILLRYQQEFGMTPSSRTRVTVEDIDPKGDEDEGPRQLRLG